MKWDWTRLWAGRDCRALEDGRELWLLTAAQVLEARREAGEMAQDEAERPLCANACLLARALRKGGRALYPDGRAVLEQMSAQEIGRLAAAWAELDREENPGPERETGELEQLKKAWSTRRKSVFAGVCSGQLGPFLRRNGSRK